MGFWLALQVLVGYTGNLHFGVIFGMFRNVPMMRAAGNEDGAKEELRTSFWFVIASGSVMTIAWFLAAPHYGEGWGRMFLAIGAALAFSNLLRNWTTSAFKAERRFAELSIASGVGSLVSLISTVGIPRFGMITLLLGALLQQVVEMTILLAWHKVPRFGVSYVVLKEQVRVGILTLLISAGVVTLTSVERTVMLRELGTAAAGLFSIGAQISILIPLVATVPTAVLTPVFFERAGRGEDFLPLVERALLLLANGFSWVIAAIALALPPTIAIIWPHLSESILACKLSMLGTYPYILASVFGNVYYAKNRQWPQAALMLLATGFTFGVSFFGVHMTGTIAGASAGTTVGMYVYLAAMIVGGFRVCNRSVRQALTFYLRCQAPMVVAIVIVLGLDRLLEPIGAPISIARALVAELLLLVAMSPFLRRAYRLLRGRA